MALGLLADVWDRSYEIRGVRVHGTKHFAPGETVYACPIHSGDGYERCWWVGRHRDTRRFTAVMGPTARLMNWRVDEVTDPAWLAEINRKSGTWSWSRARLEELAVAMNRRAEGYAAVQRRWTIPPPIDLYSIAETAGRVLETIHGHEASVTPHVQRRRVTLTVSLPVNGGPREARVFVTRSEGKLAQAPARVELASGWGIWETAPALVAFAEALVKALHGHELL